MKQGEIVICKTSDKRGLIKVGMQYVVKIHWSSFIDVFLPDHKSWVTCDMGNFYTVSELRELKLKELGI
jgi:uncharacterized protein YifN (PemK superfamily)